MISFGIGPFFAFGTESVRGAVKRISLFFGRLLATYLIASCINIRAHIRRIMNRPVNAEPTKQPRATERMTYFDDDAASVVSTPFGGGESKDSSRYYANEDISMQSTLDPDDIPRTRTQRAETDVFSDIQSGDVRLSDFMQRGGAYDIEDFE
jgi:hypothetical protein